ncbi:MAG: hypothetical protein WKG00_05145 [Polyangiaceae bacterium]
MHELRRAECQPHQPQRQEAIEPDGLLVGAPQVEHGAPGRRAQRGPHDDATAHRPQDIYDHPSPPCRAELVQAEQPHAQEHHREGRSIVEACLPRRREPQAIPVAGMRHLHLRGEHRIGGREDAAKQDRRPQRHAQDEPGDRRHQRYRDEHREGGQAQRRHPSAIA